MRVNPNPAPGPFFGPFTCWPEHPGHWRYSRHHILGIWWRPALAPLQRLLSGFDASSGSPHNRPGERWTHMNGQVLDFSIQTNSGTILGDDGSRYDFTGAEWRERVNPSRGMRVDFVAEGGNAVAVHRALETVPATAGHGLLPGAAGSSSEEINLHADSDSLPAYVVSRLLLGIGLLLVLTLLVFTLDFDHSPIAGAPVRHLIWERLPNTLSMLPLTMLIAAVISIPLGILAATRRGSWLDRVAGGAAVFGVAAPSFCIALFILLVLVWMFGWLPPLDVSLEQLFWSALVLGIFSGALMIRVIRSSIVEVLDREAIGPPGPGSGPPVGRAWYAASATS